MANKKANHGGGLDRISNLPDSVLGSILWHLPIKDAVSTSVLSTRWRNLLASVVNLNVSFYHAYPHSVESLTNFVDKMLFYHTEGRIERFRLINIDISEVATSRVCGWISAALWRGVKDLDLGFYRDNNPIMLPTNALFTSKTLVRLKLNIPSLVAVPIRVDFPSLKTLDLERIEFEDDDSTRRLFSGCPILEDLSIANCDMQNIRCLSIYSPSLKCLTLVFENFYDKFDFSIDLPSLVYFKYVDYFMRKNYLRVSMPSLVRANIDTSVGHAASAGTYHEHGFVWLFQGIRHVKSLYLTINPQALSFLCQIRYVALENMVQLELLDTLEGLKGKELFQFLEFSPNLHTLVIQRVSNEVSFPIGKAPASCLLYQLKEFKVLDFEDEGNLFKMVAYILKNATVLEKLRILTDRFMKVEEKFRITRELLRLPRSSTNCQVEAF